jgi:hypothetical protein
VSNWGRAIVGNLSWSSSIMSNWSGSIMGNWGWGGNNSRGTVGLGNNLWLMVDSWGTVGLGNDSRGGGVMSGWGCSIVGNWGSSILCNWSSSIVGNWCSMDSGNLVSILSDTGVRFANTGEGSIDGLGVVGNGTVMGTDHTFVCGSNGWRVIGDRLVDSWCCVGQCVSWSGIARVVSKRSLNHTGAGNGQRGEQKNNLYEEKHIRI